MKNEIYQFERRGLLLVLSAPSGGGKSVILRGLLESEPQLTYSVSVTSRTPRTGEVDGRDYEFISREQFEELTRQDAFYEWAEVHGNLYGTREDRVAAALDAGHDVAMDIDVQGGLSVKYRNPESVLIFLMPPNFQTLEGRLRGRESDSEEAIQLRLSNAEKEMRFWPQYDYVVVNDDLERALHEVRTILHAERHRTARLTPKFADLKV